jgi:signal transduction histidine kinase
MKKWIIFRTIRTRLTALVSLLLLGVFLLCIIANQIFLPSYYRYEKSNRLQKMYTEVSDNINRLYEYEQKTQSSENENTEESDTETADNSTADNDTSDENSSESTEDDNRIYFNFGDGWLSDLYEEAEKEQQEEEELKNVSKEAIELAIQKLGVDNSINIYVMKGLFKIYPQGVASYNANFIYPSSIENNNREKNMVLEQIQMNYASAYGLNASDDENENGNLIYKDKEGRYTIRKLHDRRFDSDYLDLVGSVMIGDNDYTIYLRSNYESIQESVKLSTRFLSYSAFVAVFFGIIMISLVSRQFTKPIVKLSKIASEMSELRFETKYEGETTDEIQVLGNSVNVLSEKLEQTISELKAANNELQNDIQEKMQIDEMRKEFLSNVTHELKTPIALIQGYAEGLQDNINDDVESRNFYCDVIIDEANKMNNMVKKLLNLNQIEFGTNQVEFERFDIVEVLKSVLNSNQIKFEQKNVDLQFEENQSIYVWADEFMTQEVITNYISNALNHVDGENVIEVSLLVKERTVRVSVRNTGAQIPEEELDKVWIKFYKVDKARTREYGGSGIGLSIVKAIMNSMHQECGVVNHVDGVEFWAEFELAEK